MSLSLILGIIFSTSKELKEAISNDTISKHYETSIIKSDLTRYIVKCRNDNYKQKLHTSQSQQIRTSDFIIQTFVSEHTYIGTKYLDNHHASISWIMDNMKNKLKDAPQYRATDIQKDI